MLHAEPRAMAAAHGEVVRRVHLQPAKLTHVVVTASTRVK